MSANLTPQARHEISHLFRCYEQINNVHLFYPRAGSGHKDELSYLYLGLAGETGEAVDVLKKLIRAGRNSVHDLNESERAKLVDEIGDIIWYIAQILRVLEYDFGDVLHENLNKLAKRNEKGYDHGLNRVEGPDNGSIEVGGGPERVDTGIDNGIELSANQISDKEVK